MQNAPLVQNSSDVAARERKLTVLTLLKSFYDEEAFGVLINDFYHEDTEISLSAIDSSGVIGNEAAIPHLFRFIETGTSDQKKTAIKLELVQLSVPPIQYAGSWQPQNSSAMIGLG